jgi:hypothetical protein
VINICSLPETARLQQNSELIKFPHTSPPQIITSFFDLSFSSSLSSSLSLFLSLSFSRFKIQILNSQKFGLFEDKSVSFIDQVAVDEK